MTPLDRVRAVALQLPEAEERESDGRPTFFVAGERFAQLRDERDGTAVVRVRASNAAGWEAVDLAGDPDWGLVEDRIAQSWELAAPARLLEAGGR